MRVVTAGQMRRIEHEAIQDYGIPSIILMENAALAVLTAVEDVLGEVENKKIVVLAGKGNNGGDGLALARHLVNRGAEVKTFICANEDQLKGDCQVNFRLLRGLGSPIFQVSTENELRAFKLALLTSDLAIDGLYGTGFRGALPPVEESYVRALNDARKPVISIDIPSGLETDSGRVYKEAVRAKITVTFGLPKLGHFLGVGPEYVGELRVDKISIPADRLEDSKVSTHVLTKQKVAEFMPKRIIRGHKGTHGTCLCIGGSPGMTGALALATRAALRSGAGIAQMAVGESLAPMVDGLLLEAITVILAELQPGILDPGSIEKIEAQLSGANAVAFGPGMGRSPEVQELLGNLVQSYTKPLIIDADGLNVLADDLKMLARMQGPVILTPHPGEMARLCGMSVYEVQNNRLELAQEKAVEWGVTLVLKGMSTLIVSPDGQAFINPTGNPVLGTGGTGDVLTGCILGLLAQGASPLEATCLGVYAHGLAGDLMAEQVGMRGVLAHEIADTLPKIFSQIEEY